MPSGANRPSIFTAPRGRLKLEWTRVKRYVRDLVSGDTQTLRKVCAEGILESFRKRIAARAGEKWDWNLRNYAKTPRVVSNRAAQLPLDEAGLRQAVVKIESRQSLTRTGADGKRVPGTGTEKVVREYVVIQKQMFGGKESSWLIWGTTEETTLSKLAAEEKKDL
ncbi:MAG: hypothetical protein M1836_007839 [Candelina mexicana]|nr:MAG: hypothetical protein M1836_007839 [Candelina mexicana]